MSCMAGTGAMIVHQRFSSSTEVMPETMRKQLFPCPQSPLTRHESYSGRGSSEAYPGRRGQRIVPVTAMSRSFLTVASKTGLPKAMVRVSAGIAMRSSS